MAEQHDATASQCLAMPKLYMSVPMLCHSTGLLFNAETKRTLTLPLLCFSSLCPRFTSLSQNHAPLSHGNTLPGPFIAIQCLYFAMPVLTSRCSASAIRFLSLPQRNVTYPRLYSAYLRSALTPLIPASPLLINAFHCPCPAYQGFASAPQINSAT